MKNFGASIRIDPLHKPNMICPNKNDRYTVGDTKNGNGLLSNPVGLITADEEMFAGVSTRGQNAGYYLYNGDSCWTSTSNYYHVDFGAQMLFAGYSNNDSNYNGVRPVINLKADVEFTGTGTIDDPYVIVTE